MRYLVFYAANNHPHVCMGVCTTHIYVPQINERSKVKFIHPNIFQCPLWEVLHLLELVPLFVQILSENIFCNYLQEKFQEAHMKNLFRYYTSVQPQTLTPEGVGFENS